jgi:hypothetical protein
VAAEFTLTRILNRRSIEPNSLPTEQELSMPTALPIPYATKIVGPPKFTDSLRPVWLIVIWAIVMFWLGTFADKAAETGAMIDPFQLLMAF